MQDQPAVTHQPAFSTGEQLEAIQTTQAEPTQLRLHQRSVAEERMLATQAGDCSQFGTQEVGRSPASGGCTRCRLPGLAAVLGHADSGRTPGSGFADCDAMSERE